MVYTKAVSVVAFLLFSMSLTLGAGVPIVPVWCYQETANVSSVCDTITTPNNGTYNQDDPSVYMNYTKPVGALNTSLWQVKHGNLTTYNVSLPGWCWNYSSTNLQLRLSSVTGFSSYGQCYNGTWNTISNISSIAGGSADFANGDWHSVIDGNWSSHAVRVSVLGWKIAPNDADSGVFYRIYEEAMWWAFNGTPTKNVSLNNYTCYQETANLSTPCGGLSTGSYVATGVVFINSPANMFDGDWNTRYDADYSAGGIGNLWVNYSKPATAYNGTVTAKFTCNADTVSSYSVPSDCFNQSPLQFHYYIKAGNYNEGPPYYGGYNYTCYNGSAWKELASSLTCILVSAFYEEAITWNMSGCILNNSNTMYYLNESKTCNITIIAENTTLDGLGNQLTGSTVVSNSKNIYIKNLTTVPVIGLTVDNSFDGVFENITIINATDKGISIQGGAKRNNFTSIKINSSGSGLYIDTISSENLLKWNNFTSIIGVYVNDTNGSNFYNSTEGNIWRNVLNGSVVIYGGIVSGVFPGFYVGEEGSGYPYGNSTSYSKFFCAGGCGDYAPFTTRTSVCANLTTAGQIYLVNSTLRNNMNSTCMNISAANVTLNCGGRRIIGNASAGGYGVYSNQFNTTTQNCNISKFDIGVYYNAANNGTIKNISFDHNTEDIRLEATSRNNITNITTLGIVGNVGCYQETANVSTTCGGLATGNYTVVGTWDSNTALYDGNWSSNSYSVPDGSDGYLYFSTGTKTYGNLATPADYTVSGDTLYLKADREYKFTSFYLGPGTTLSTLDTAGAVLYISAPTGSIIIEGTVSLSGIGSPGQKSISATIDGATYTNSGSAAGGAGGHYSDDGAAGAQTNGFGGGGGGGYAWAYGCGASSVGGNGANGSSTAAGGGSGGSASASSPGCAAAVGGVAPTPGGGGGGGAGQATVGGGSYSCTMYAVGGAGGAAYGANGGNGVVGYSHGSPWSCASGWGLHAAGGGGGGGTAGISGYHFVAKANIISVAGTITTSGTSGGKGGNGGQGYDGGTSWPPYPNEFQKGNGGGGGGGGYAGTIYLKYGSLLNVTGTLTSTGGSGGAGGTGQASGGSGTTASTPSAQRSAITPFAYFDITYSKPTNASSASVWYAKNGVATQDISIPTSCWSQTPLKFRITSSCTNTTPDNAGMSLLACYNGTVFAPVLFSSGNSACRIYEEAMKWNIPGYSPPEVTVSTTYDVRYDGNISLSSGSRYLPDVLPTSPNSVSTLSKMLEVSNRSTAWATPKIYYTLSDLGAAKIVEATLYFGINNNASWIYPLSTINTSLHNAEMNTSTMGWITLFGYPYVIEIKNQSDGAVFRSGNTTLRGYITLYPTYNSSTSLRYYWTSNGTVVQGGAWNGSLNESTANINNYSLIGYPFEAYNLSIYIDTPFAWNDISSNISILNDRDNLTFGTNISRIRFVSSSALAQNVEPINQSASNSLFKTNITAPANASAVLKLLAAIPGANFKCSATNNSSSAIALTNAYTSFINTSGTGVYNIWCWADFSAPHPSTQPFTIRGFVINR